MYYPVIFRLGLCLVIVVAEAALTSWWCVWAAAGLGPAPGLRCPAAASGRCQPADLWPRMPRPGSGTWRTPSAAAVCWPGSPPSSDRWRPAPTVSSLPRESQTWLGKKEESKIFKFFKTVCTSQWLLETWATLRSLVVFASCGQSSNLD